MKVQIKSKHIPMILSLDQGEIPEGIIIEKLPVQMQRDGLSESLGIAIITLAASVPIGVFINWLSNKLFVDQASTKITINRKEIHFDEGQITRLIEETRTIEQGKIND
jgi:hypothetical protein